VFLTDEALHRAALAAAVASGWARLRVLQPAEASLLATQAELETLVGPLAQADVIEPGDPSDPDWELDVILPGIDVDTAARIDAQLAEHPHAWSTAPSQATASAHHRGLLLEETLRADDVVATCLLSTPHGLLVPDLARVTDLPADLEPLAAALFLALHEADPTLCPPQAEELVTAAVHRPSGRPGVEMWLPPSAFEGHDGDAVLARRHAVVAAVASVLREPPVPVDPHLQWWPRLGGMVLWLPLVSPPGPPLHSQPPIADSTTPGPRALAAFLRDEGFVHDLELQLLEADPHVALDALLAAGGEHAIGAEPTWVPTIDGPLFAPTWRIPLDDVALLGRLAVAWRVVPGVPVGLDDAAPWLDRYAHWGPERVAVRCRDATVDADRQPLTLPRALTGADTALLQALLPALPQLDLKNPEAIVPVAASDARHGLRIDAPAAAVPHAGALLDALTALPHPSLASWVDVAFPRSGGLRLHVWARSAIDGVRTWEPLRGAP